MAKKDLAAVAVNDLILAQAGTGLEGVQADDLAIPFVSILQSGSPQVKKSNPNFVDGAEEGFIFNSVTGEIYSGDEGIVVIPCAYTKNYNEWKDRNDGGGGFVTQHDRNTPILDNCSTHPEKNVLVTPNGNHMILTSSHYVIIVRDVAGEVELTRAIISMASTNLTISRKWNTIMSSKKIKHGNEMITPPTFAYMYNLASVADSNDQGDWMKWKVSEVGPVTEAYLIKEAIDFNAAIMKGSVKVATPTNESGGDDTDSHI